MKTASFYVKSTIEGKVLTDDEIIKKRLSENIAKKVIFALCNVSLRCGCKKNVRKARSFLRRFAHVRFANGKTTQCSSVFCVNRPLFVTGLFALKQVVVRGTKLDGFSFFAMPFGTLTTNFCFF